MSAFINISPPQRRRSTSELAGEAFGSGFGGATERGADTFLQGKVNQMFRNQERDRARPSALALAKMLNVPEDQRNDMAEMLIDNPGMAAQAFAHRPSLASFNQRLGMTPPPNTMGIPNPNMNAPPANAMQFTGQKAGMPDAGFLPAMKQQNQQEIEQAPYQAQMAAQAARNEEGGQRQPFPAGPQQNGPGQGDTGIEIPEIQPKPSLEEFNKRYAAENSAEGQAAALSDYKGAQARHIESTKAHNDAIAQEEKMRRSREKSGAQTPADEKFLEEASSAALRADELVSSLDEMEELVKGGNTGILWDPSDPQQRKARALMESCQVPIDAVIRNDVFKGGNLTNDKFRAILEKWTPAPGITDATNLGRIAGLRKLAQYGLKMQKALDAIRNPDGTYPKALRGKVDQFLSDDKKKVRDMLFRGPESVLSDKMEVDKPPPASAFEEGQGFTDNETHIKYVKKNGKMVPK